MYLLFGSLLYKNFTVKRVWFGVTMRYVTFDEFSRKRINEDKTC